MSCPTIFVCIASYRDIECWHTLRSMFENAANPSRVFAGVCLQVLPSDPQKMVNPVSIWPKQIRIGTFNAKQSKGLGWARQQAVALWQGEDFYLQIDAHSRFVSNWDDLLLSLHGQYTAQDAARKIIISTYPNSYFPSTSDAAERCLDDTFTIMHFYKFDANGIPFLGGQAWSLLHAPKPAQSIRRYLCAGGFLFTTSTFIQDVPHDPYIYFNGEEIGLSVRAWTNGYDIFCPTVPVIFHYYSNPSTKHWQDDPVWNDKSQMSVARLKFILWNYPALPQHLIEIDKYSLGSKRTLQQYQQEAGIDFVAKVIHEKRLNTATLSKHLEFV